MKLKILLCLFLIVIISPTAMTQNDSADQETRLTRIEVTLEQMNHRISSIESDVNRIDGRLDTLILSVVGLLAASFISIFVLILQIKTRLSEMNLKFETQLIEMNAKFEAHLSEMNLKFETQLIEMNAKFGLLQKDMSTLNEKVGGLEKRVDRVEEQIDGIEERVDGFERRIGAQLNQIQKALAKQLDMDIDDEPLT
ncbi:hypothetical protein C6501_14360 [Candidatus Poribacteria bacterium]|nr:MAG: hypothetical protein C6501_14360 [Candidatus Poribacteria bacterium]